VSETERVQLEQAFVLHQRSYKNTSQLIDCLTERHGILSLVAQGSRRPAKGQRAILQPFIPLAISWTRRGDLGRLIHAESAAATMPLTGSALLAGYYVNELILRLMAKGDPNASAYTCYTRCLASLAQNAGIARALRLFEFGLLRALGYGVELGHDVETGQPINAGLCYRFEAERGVYVCAEPDDRETTFLGRDLIAMHEGDLKDDGALRAAKRLLRTVLSIYLGDRPLKTSRVIRDVVGRGLAT